MSATGQTQIVMLLSLLAAQVPTLVVCLTALVVTFVRWNEAPKAAVWALLGFGLAVILCIIMPLTQAGVHEWLIRSGIGTHAGQARTALAALGFAWSILRALTYAFLAVAIFAGRRRSPP